jgi:hypothetical protein
MFKRIAQIVLIAPVMAMTMVAVAHADETATIRAALAKVLPDFKVTNVSPTPIKGLYQVEIGPQVMFVTGDGNYLIDGAIVDLKTRENIADSAQAKARLRAHRQRRRGEHDRLRCPERKAHRHRLHRHRLRLLPQAA